MKKTNIGDKSYHYAELDLALISEDKYKDLSHRDIVLFTLLKNQESLSKNSVKLGNMEYVDSDGYIFIRISQEKLSRILKISEPTLRSGLKNLEKHDLIEVCRIGKNECNIIYVGEPETSISYSEYIKLIGEEIKQEKKNKEEKNKVKSNNKVNKSNVINLDIKKDLPVAADKPLRKVNKKTFNKNIIPYEIAATQEEELIDISENLKLIIDNGIKLPKNISSVLKSEINRFDSDLLLRCIEYMKSNNKKLNLNYLLQIYKSPKFLNYKKDTIEDQDIYYNVNNKFRNFNETFTIYTPDQLDEIIEKSQKEKFPK